MEEKKKSGLSVVSLVLGIASILLCSIGLIPGIVGLILGIISKAKKKGGPALAGIITSVVGTVLQLVSTIGIIVCICVFGLSAMFSAFSQLNPNPNTTPTTDPYATGLIVPDDPYADVDYTFGDDDDYTYGDDDDDPYATGLIVPDDPYAGVEITNNGPDFSGSPSFTNGYVELYPYDDGSIGINLINTFSPYQEFTTLKASLDQCYKSINAIRAADNLAPIPEDLFYEFVTITLCDTQYLESEDEDISTQAEIMMAIAAQAAATTIDLCPDAHVLYGEELSSMVYRVYLDNGMTIDYNCSADSSNPDYPFYVIINANGTIINNYYTSDNLLVYVLALAQAMLH